MLIGSTGYGFGDTEGVSCTEALAANFADQATTWEVQGATSGQPIGLALAAAKREYLGSLAAITTYDEKSSVEFTMYGMPQYRLACTTHEPTTGVQAGLINPQGATFDFDTVPATNFTLTVTDQGVDTAYEATLKESNRDSNARYLAAYHTVNGVTSGDAEATFGTPIQPRMVIDLGPAGTNPVKSVIISDRSHYTDYIGFNPAIATVTTEWSDPTPELQLATDGWWPSSPAVLSSIQTTDGGEQRLVVLPGQFLSTSPRTEQVSGTERVWDSLHVTLVRAPSNAPNRSDKIGPTVHSVTLSNDGTTWTAKVDAEDLYGIASVSVTQLDGSNADTVPFSVGGDTSPYTLHFPVTGAIEDVEMMFFVTDNNGVTTTCPAKGSMWSESANAHTISASHGTGGSISPVDDVIVNDGASQTFAITPNAGQHVADVLVDGVSQGAITSYTFSGVSSDHTISASFTVDSSTLLQVTTLAGSAGSIGSADGPGGSARFNQPAGVACDSSGNVYVADSNNYTIRKITPAGVVTTFAGSPGVSGKTDGSGSSARFFWPAGVACDAFDNIYVADEGNAGIRKIAPDGTVTTLAGGVAMPGYADGTGSTARFYQPEGVACDASGNVYVADTFNHVIRKITSAGVVTTLAGLHGSPGSNDGSGTVASFRYPSGVTCDASGNVYVADQGNDLIRKVTPAGVVTTVAGTGTSGHADGTGTGASFNNPGNLVCDASGDLWVADLGNNAIRKINPSGVVTTLAGSAGTTGSSDGAGPAARFNAPYGIARDAIGTLFVTDAGSGTVRMAVCPSTAGGWINVTQTGGGTVALDGQSGAAPARVAVQHGNDQTFAITPGLNHHVADVLVDGVSKGSITNWAFMNVAEDHSIAATFAADWFGLTVGTTGQGSVARVPDLPTYAYGSSVALTATAAPGWEFTGWGGDAGGSANPLTVTMDRAKNVTATFVVDPATLLHVATLAGAAGVPGADDGTGSAARFNYPDGPVCDSSGNIYVADGVNKTIRKVTPAGVVTTVAGSAGLTGTTDGTGSAARFTFPKAVACDSYGNLYVADNQTIRKITAAGEVTTFAGLAGNPGSDDGTGSAARFTYPSGVACDGAGNIFVADTQNNTIRMITPAGVVSTLAGSPGVSGSADGQGSTALFNQPESVACDAFGNVYVADSSNQTIRKVTTAGDVTTIAGLAGEYGSVDGTGGAARFWSPSGVACDASGNVYVVDTGSTIRKVTPAGHVTTVAGSLGNWGSADGVGSAASFNAAGVACDAVGNLYVADTSNSTIRHAVCPAAVGGFIRVTQGAGGTVSLSGQPGAASAAVAVQHGNDQSFDITPDASYHIVDVLVDGVSQGGLIHYTFSGVTADHSIAATYAADPAAPLFAAHVDHATGTNPNSVAVGDFNGDGRQDLAAANDGDGSVSVLLGGDGGAFAAKADYASGGHPAAVAVGDFNGDGRQDLAAANYSSDTVSVLLGNGNGTFAAKVDYAAGAGPYSVAVGDFNGDGKQDLATANVFGDSVSVLLGSGSGTFGAKTDYATGAGPTSVAVGDFNGDGRQDLVTANANAGNSVSILLGSGSGTFAAKIDYATGATPESVAIGDFNCDGRKDLVTANQGGGQRQRPAGQR